MATNTPLCSCFSSSSTVSTQGIKACFHSWTFVLISEKQSPGLCVAQTNMEDDQGQLGFRSFMSTCDIVSSAAAVFARILRQRLRLALKGSVFSGNLVHFSLSSTKLSRMLQGCSAATCLYGDTYLEGICSESALLLISGCKLRVFQTR